MKKGMLKLLLELMKDSKKSDRELAKVLGVSQPTVTRTRNKLVKEGLIREFTVIPDFVKMGFEILAISSFKSKSSNEVQKRAFKWTASKPNVVFAARAEGEGKNALVVSLHTDYTDYSHFVSEIMLEGENIVSDYDTLLVSLKGLIVKPFSLKYIADLYEKTAE